MPSRFGTRLRPVRWAAARILWPLWILGEGVRHPWTSSGGRECVPVLDAWTSAEWSLHVGGEDRRGYQDGEIKGSFFRRTQFNKRFLDDEISVNAQERETDGMDCKRESGTAKWNWG